MIDGGTKYFLSGYLTPPGPTAVFSVRHDHNLALWRHRAATVELVRLWEFERISGQKHHFWPLYTVERAMAFVAALLAEEGLTPDDISAFWGTPGLPGFRPVPVPPGAEGFPIHSLAHLFTGLMLDTQLFKQSQIIGLAIDAQPDYVQDSGPTQNWYAGCVARAGQITFTPVESPAPLFTAAQTMFGLEPGTLMALASAVTTEIEYDCAAAIADISLHGGVTPPWKAAFRLVRTIVEDAERQLLEVALDPSFTQVENLRSAVMKVVQRCSELIAIRNIEHMLELSGMNAADTYLSTTGGYALNCPTNTMLIEHFGFRGLLSPPCANDSGQGLGVGLLALYGTGVFDDADLLIADAYQGRDLVDVEDALAEFAPWVESVADFAPEQFAVDVTDGVVAWVNGRAEIGPRALGHRSLLADPRSSTAKDLLNTYKQRQWWRPVAPLVMAEHVGEWFSTDRNSPYMLEAVQVRPDVRDRVPAIVHLDGSARHQVLARDTDPLLHGALAAFRDATGVPILCNTSLNDKGEAIVDTAAETLTFCVRKGIRIAYLGGRRVKLRTTPQPAAEMPSGPRPRAVGYFRGQEADRDAIWADWLGRGFTVAGMYLLARTPGLRAEQAGSTPERVNMLAEYRSSVDPTFSALVENFGRTHGPGGSFTDPSTLTGAYGVVAVMRATG